MVQSGSNFRITRMDNVPRFKLRNSFKGMVNMYEDKVSIANVTLLYSEIKHIEIGMERGVSIAGINFYCVWT